MDVVQSLVELLFLAVEKFDFLVNPVFGGLDGGSFIIIIIIIFINCDLGCHPVAVHTVHSTRRQYTDNTITIK
jgi:hypothetical protein